MIDTAFTVTRMPINCDAQSLRSVLAQHLGDDGLIILQYADRVETQPIGQTIDPVNLQFFDAFAAAAPPRHITGNVASGQVSGILMAKGSVGPPEYHITCVDRIAQEALCLGKIVDTKNECGTLAEQRINQYTLPGNFSMDANLVLEYEEWIQANDDGQCHVAGYAVTGVKEYIDGGAA